MSHVELWERRHFDGEEGEEEEDDGGGARVKRLVREMMEERLPAGEGDVGEEFQPTEKVTKRELARRALEHLREKRTTPKHEAEAEEQQKVVGGEKPQRARLKRLSECRGEDPKIDHRKDTKKGLKRLRKSGEMTPPNEAPTETPPSPPTPPTPKEISAAAEPTEPLPQRKRQHRASNLRRSWTSLAQRRSIHFETGPAVPAAAPSSTEPASAPANWMMVIPLPPEWIVRFELPTGQIVSQSEARRILARQRTAPLLPGDRVAISVPLVDD